MAIVKRSNGPAMLERTRSEFDRFFDEMWRTPNPRFFRTPSLFEMADTQYLHWHPMADIEETGNVFIVTLELPGVDKKDINVSIDNNTLNVRGERKWDDSKNRQFHLREINHRPFYRSFTLPGLIDRQAVTAEYKDGILTVTVKKRDESRPKDIEIH